MRNRFEDLIVWKKAHELVIEIYKITAQFPLVERYSLTDQLRRASSSVATNIVEGNEYRSKKEFLKFLYIAKASLAEVIYQLVLAKDLGYLIDIDYTNLKNDAHEVAKMINGLIKYLKL